MLPKDRIESAVVVGSGNVAEAMAWALAEAWGVELSAVLARNEARAIEIANSVGCDYSTDFSNPPRADIYIIAVSDRAVESVASSLDVGAEAVVVHTAGSVAMESLGSKRRGVLYPFQTFTAGRRVDFSQVPLFIEASDKQTLAQLSEFANALSSRVYEAGSERRREIHLSGVLACNFVNALYAMAADRLIERESLPFDVLRPLIEETARKAIDASHPGCVQTGPARRGDMEVAERHIQMLSDSDLKANIYRLLTHYIYKNGKL